MRLIISSGKWRPFGLGLNGFIIQFHGFIWDGITHKCHNFKDDSGYNMDDKLNSPNYSPMR